MLGGMASKRTYGDACGVARALDVVGERWALMIVRELLLGPKRFTDLRVGLPGVSPDVLAQRLRELEQADVVARRKLPPPAAAQVYELTAKGRALETVIMELGRWGGANAYEPLPDMGMSLDSHVISLQALFAPALAEGLRARVDLRLGDQRFKAEVADGAFTVVRGAHAEPDATITAEAGDFLALVRGVLDLDAALAAGRVTIDGDVDLVRRFLTLFPLPAPAGTAEPAAAPAL
jgi:DNA-binding HxlR family transcriptional regulator/putative sterol carrier protein